MNTTVTAPNPLQVPKWLQKLEEATTGRYEMRRLPGVTLQYHTVNIAEVLLAELPAVRESIPAEVVDSIDWADPASILRGLQSWLQSIDFEALVTTGTAALGIFRLLAAVVSAGVPDLAGRIHPTAKDLPRDEEGAVLPFHFTAGQLGEDLMGLFWAVYSRSAGIPANPKEGA